MPLDDNLLDAIAGTIAETEREFRKKLEELEDNTAARFATENDILGLQIDATRDDIQEIRAELAKTVDSVTAALTGTLRESRLELNESLFAAAKRFDQLAVEMAERLATLKDGKAGLPGEPGIPGERGEKGDPGEPAPDPTEDMVAAALEKLREDRLEIDERLFAAAKRFDRLSAELEQRLATLKDGEPGPAGPEGAPGRDGLDGRTGDACGLYAAAETYRKMDRVSLNGSEWIARKDDPGPLPGDGWMLGAQGKTGKPGASIQRITAKDYALVLEMSDGKKIPIDLRGMFERYDEERGE